MRAALFAEEHQSDERPSQWLYLVSEQFRAGFPVIHLWPMRDTISTLFSVEGTKKSFSDPDEAHPLAAFFWRKGIHRSTYPVSQKPWIVVQRLREESILLFNPILCPCLRNGDGVRSQVVQ